MATIVNVKLLIQLRYGRPHLPLVSASSSIQFSSQKNVFSFANNFKLSSGGHEFTPCSRQILGVVTKASSKNESIVEADEEDGVQLGTMKLPPNLDVARFESLLFQWANSLCQGATLPLPMPLKVDKIAGGVRLGFIIIEDARTEVPVYIDCLVFPSSEESGPPVFRAIRNGPTKDRSPPGEPRIMTSLQEALKKSVAIATV